jgi:hypothetical protein
MAQLVTPSNLLWLPSASHGLCLSIEPVPLNQRVAARSYRRYQLEHRDPAIGC